MTLSGRLELAYRELGTWEAVARAIGTSTANVTRWKDGSEPGAAFYDKLMAFLEVDLDELGALIVRDQYLPRS